MASLFYFVPQEKGAWLPFLAVNLTNKLAWVDESKVKRISLEERGVWPNDEPRIRRIFSGRFGGSRELQAWRGGPSFLNLTLFGNRDVVKWIEMCQLDGAKEKRRKWGKCS